MPTCTNKTLRWHGPKRNPETGKYPLVNNPSKSPWPENPIATTCGKCEACILNRCNEWAMRCAHETEMHDESAFLTLSFHEKYIDHDYSLRRETFTNFIKRYRKWAYPKKLRYFQCGEYGTKRGRPHHHCLIWGHQFEDFFESKYSDDQQKHMIHRSRKLEELWGMGQCWIGEANYETAGYIAKYCTKNQTASEIEKYSKLGRLGEFNTFSTRPPIGIPWFRRYTSDCFPSDTCIINGFPHPVPKAYLRDYAKNHPEEARAVVRARIKSASAFTRRHPEECTPERDATKAEILRKKIDERKRE